MPGWSSSSEGTKEITIAALAATLAVIAIFLPVIFMTGVIGKFFFQFGVTLSVAVMLSYFEANARGRKIYRSFSCGRKPVSSLLHPPSPGSRHFTAT